MLCALVNHSQAFRTEYALEDKTTFHCKDALDADLSNAGVIWIDNQSWDEHLTNSIYTKLNNDVIPGALIVEYAMSDYHAGSTLHIGDSLDLVGCAKLDVSWDNNVGTTVSLFQKREGKYTGSYYDWSDYGVLLRKKLVNVRRMVNDVGDTVLLGPLTVLDDAASHEVDTAMEVVLDLRSELLVLENVEREDRYILSSEKYRNRIMTLYSTVLFNWYLYNSQHRFQTQDDLIVDRESSNTNEPVSAASSTSSTSSSVAWTKNEIGYLRTFALLSGQEFYSYHLNGQWVGNRMSGYSYSHTLDTSNKKMTISNRLRIGTHRNQQTRIAWKCAI